MRLGLQLQRSPAEGRFGKAHERAPGDATLRNVGVATSRATVATSEAAVSPRIRSAVRRYAPGCASVHVFGSGERPTLGGNVSRSGAMSDQRGARRRATGASGVSFLGERPKRARRHRSAKTQPCPCHLA
jgi:hypothetical protein